MIKQSLSTYSGNIAAIYQTLKYYNIDADKLFLKAGVGQSYPSDKNARLPSDALENLINLATEEVDNQTFGLKFADYIQPSSYHALGIALLFSDTLRSFFQRLERYYALISTMEEVEFTETSDYACLSNHILSEYSGTAKRWYADGWAAVMVKFVRLVMGPDYNPAKVELTGNVADNDLQQYQDYFKAPVYFSSPVNVIYFNSEDLDKVLPTSNSELARQNEKLVVEFLSKMQSVDLPAQVYTKIIEFLPSGKCSRERVAQALNMSVRSFHNKLEKAGTSYQQLLDATRKELAEQYIKQDNITTFEIAYLLGFSDSSNFSRAFRRWHGITPKKYRENLYPNKTVNSP